MVPLILSGCPPHPADAVSLFLRLTPSSLRQQLCPPLLIKIPSNAPHSISGLGRCPIPFAPLQLWRGGKCKRARLQRGGRTDKSHHRGNVFKMSNMCFSILTFCSQADMQIIVGTVAVCSFLSDPVLFLFPAWPHPHQCQLYIGSQHPPAMWRALFLFPTPDFLFRFVCLRTPW